MPEASSQPAPTPVLVRDLLLASQIRVAATHAGVPIRLLRDPAKLAEEPGARRAVIDCNLDGAIDAAAAYKCRTGAELTGFVSHVDGQTIAHARQAGFDRVMARSAFFKDPTAYL